MSIPKEFRELTGGGQKRFLIHFFLHPWCMERDLIVMSTEIKITEINVVLHAAAVSIKIQVHPAWFCWNSGHNLQGLPAANDGN